MDTFRTRAEKSTLDEFIDVTTLEPLLEFHREEFARTGDTLQVLAAFVAQAECSIPVDTIAIPIWIVEALAVGFDKYLTSLANGEESTLECSLNITQEIKDEAMAVATMDEMMERVHLHRWLFGIKSGVAVRATYMLHKNMIDLIFGKQDHLAKIQGFTRDESGFTQHYQRNHAGNFKQWVSLKEGNGEKPTELQRQQVLSLMSDNIVKLVKRNWTPLKP